MNNKPVDLEGFRNRKQQRGDAICSLELAAEVAVDAKMSIQDFVSQAARQYNRAVRLSIIEKNQM